jgi:hypothetical protein
MVICDVVVKRFESLETWYIGSVSEFFWKLGHQDTGPKIEEKYAINFTRKHYSLFEALNQILPVEFWGVVMYDFIDKSVYPHAIPICFWERLTTNSPTQQDCMNEKWRLKETIMLNDADYTGNIRFILWDTRAGGSDRPGVHIPRDDRFSGRSYVDASLNGDRELTASWRKWAQQQEKRNTSTPKIGGGINKRSFGKQKADLEVCLNTLKELYI